MNCLRCGSANTRWRRNVEMWFCRVCKHKSVPGKAETKGSGQIAGRTFKRMIVHGERNA